MTRVFGTKNMEIDSWNSKTQVFQKSDLFNICMEYFVEKYHLGV